tara:strand:+ start:489 stop:980 length:492 start_codon:yes stop_codon:yes gene_type:complete
MGRKKKKMFRTPKIARRQARKRRSRLAGRREREFLYRGYKIEELKAMPLVLPDDDPGICIADIVPAKVRRTLLNGLPREQQHLYDRVVKSERTVRTHCRSMYVMPAMVGKTIAIHNGQKFVEIEVREQMIGHALGEFAPTRRGVTHTGVGVGATRGSKHVALK